MFGFTERIRCGDAAVLQLSARIHGA